MQEIKKRRIVLASLLKPVDDTRMFEKLATTLASEYEVYVIGQPSKNTSAASVVTISLPAHGRQSARRLLAPWRVLGHVLRLKPDVLIVCTAELLSVALCARLLAGSKIIYDIQENYAQNIRHGYVWPRALRPVLAALVRIMEWCSSFVVSHFLLAEQSYAQELKFLRDKFTIVENKAIPFEGGFEVQRRKKPRLSTQSGAIRLLFTGTLAETTGVFEAIALAKRLHDTEPNISLRIVGYAAQNKVQDAIKKEVFECPFISAESLDQLVPHHVINEAIRDADFGIISYPRNISTWNSHPTKLFEYLGNQLPILLVNNPRWVSYCSPYSAAVIFNPDDFQTDVRPLMLSMRTATFYTVIPENVFWNNEVPKLLTAVAKSR